MARPRVPASPLSWFRWTCGLALVLGVVVAVGASLRWPLVGDASLMHYIVFLQRQGLVPYRDIIDVNLPGTYAFEALAMRCFGSGALGWRLYDLFLLFSIALAAMVLAGKRSLFAAVLAGSLFALVHLQDGVAQGGQRNLLMAALLLWAYAALFHAQKPQNAGDMQKPYVIRGMALLYGLLLGATVTIKPVLLPLGLLLLLFSAITAHRRGCGAWHLLWPGLLGMLAPPGAALAWLWQAGNLQPFLQLCANLLPLHARLGRHPLPFLLAHCLSPIAPLAGLWLLLQLVERSAWSAEKLALFLGVLGTAFAYLLEGKGFPYQRYPLLALLLLLMGIDLNRALAGTGVSRALAIVACALSCFILAPKYAWLSTTFSSEAPLQEALSAELLQLGSPSQLQGQVQCLDTFGGCINSLLDLQVRQSTGFVYDCYLFTEDSKERARYRRAFWAVFSNAKPRLVIETDQFCFGDRSGFDKLATWPELADQLHQNYVLKTTWTSPVLQHWSSRQVQPSAFRIYERKP